MIKRFIIAFILLVIVVGGLVGFNIFRDRAIEQFFADMPTPAVTVSTTEVKSGEWSPVIEAIGTVKAASGVDLTVETTGIVKEINFDANEHVGQGQILIQMDDAVERADLEAARAQAKLDQTNLDRALELQSRGVGSNASLESAAAAATASKAQVAKLEAVLDQKQLKAPFDGVIGLSRVDVGQYLSPGTIVATLQDLETMRVDFTIPEQHLGELKIGQPVRMGLSSEDMPYEGEIVGIDPKIDPTTRLIFVRARITNPDERLSPGQFAQIRVQLPAEDDVLSLPQTALITSLYGDYVYVVREAENDGESDDAGQEAQTSQENPEGAAQEQPAEQSGEQQPQYVVKQVFVESGRRLDGMVEIVKGLSAGDMVVTAGQNRLTSGTSVKIDNSIDPTRLVQEGAAEQ
ncbi:membrane fusion protein (multidrug efflux system) [Mesorhizobium sp. J18]|uniref:efflux RND transporter periplasmic adaptor subunit n=1 Tax=Mesorhizobium sp. J18 TaxID=935263 RepID=UPI00119BB408|nr:efflux RND transporter periplasmic adaptor subunit [Mesorhizobium sp. J18]TWH01240.1 membrane fusion protein (multidrug efflux system) [Mesorhizobium sp. J18]